MLSPDRTEEEDYKKDILGQSLSPHPCCCYSEERDKGQQLEERKISVMVCVGVVVVGKWRLGLRA